MRTRVAVVGGSIGGLTAAAVLRDAGCDVAVYERSPTPLEGVGTGIVVQPQLVRYMVERTEVTIEQISVGSQAMRYYRADTEVCLGAVDADWRFTSYNVLYHRLLAALEPSTYHLGHALVGLQQTADEVELRFASGDTVHCDLAVCADGGSSVARQVLLRIRPAYSGYVTWRGVVARERVSAQTWDFFDDAFSYGLLDDGHLIAYPIPLVHGGDVVDRAMNFQWYRNVTEGPVLDELMTDSSGTRRTGSVHFAALRSAALDDFHRSADDRLSASFAELVTAAPEPFVTTIGDAETPQMAIGRVALVGDAAFTPRPHAAAGGAKAASDAWALADALTASNRDVPSALVAWEAGQLPIGRAYLAKVRRMGRHLQHGGPFLPGDPDNRFGLPDPTADRMATTCS